MSPVVSGIKKTMFMKGKSHTSSDKFIEDERQRYECMNKRVLHGPKDRK